MNHESEDSFNFTTDFPGCSEWMRLTNQNDELEKFYMKCIAYDFPTTGIPHLERGETLTGIFVAGELISSVEPELDEDDIEWIEELLKPPESRLGREILFSKVPDEWLDWPCHVEVAYTPIGYDCVSESEEYDVLNVEEATNKLFAPGNEEILAGYRIHTVGIASPYRWNVSWPLFRRGNEKGIVKREKRQGNAPWYWYDDDTLFEIWNKPLDSCGKRQGALPWYWYDDDTQLDSYEFKTRFMLTVGGRTKEEAVENWHLLVKPLRKRFKEVRSNPSSL